MRSLGRFLNFLANAAAGGFGTLGICLLFLMSSEEYVWQWVIASWLFAGFFWMLGQAAFYGLVAGRDRQPRPRTVLLFVLAWVGIAILLVTMTM